MKNLIKIKNLSKKFGSLKAVRNISFNLNQGEILGFLGPNGAGKTTTMRMITGFLKPTEGEVLINGLKIDDHPESCKKFIGYVAEGSPLYVEMTTLDFLRFSAKVRKIEKNLLDKSLENVIKLLDLDNILFQKIDTFGHITDASWFITLDKPYLIKLVRELADIWNYRASLTPMIKTAICPPHGNPFSGIEMNSLTIQSEQRLKMNILNIFDNLLSKSPERNNQALGAFYILGSLTLVSQSAANALPWLYESVFYLPNNQNA